MKAAFRPKIHPLRTAQMPLFRWHRENIITARGGGCTPPQLQVNHGRGWKRIPTVITIREIQ
jgi:hypothetical protein